MLKVVTAHTQEDLDRLSRAAKREFSRAFMSDTKWRKLFPVLEDPELGLRQMTMKFIDVPDAKVMSLPTIGMAFTPKEYIDTIQFGPIEFRSIEWLEIPAMAIFPRSNNVPARVLPQDIDGLEAKLIAGRFPVERSSDGLRVVGYRR